MSGRRNHTHHRDAEGEPGAEWIHHEGADEATTNGTKVAERAGKLHAAITIS
jgi:hypothetical protein